jgi:FAD/FMN-containing dehydrogenase
VLEQYAGIVATRVARCASAADVVAAIASADGLPVAVRSGGHDFAGRSSTTGLLIDMTPMNAMSLDGELVHVGGGVLQGALYDFLAAHGRTFAGGCGPEVGLAGLLLGGGIGILGRTYGLTCDQLVAAEVVLADGSVVECDDGDLFWALRGAGGGRFGVVTRFTLRTVPAPRMTVFHAVYPASIIDRWQRWEPPDSVAASLLCGASCHVFGASIGAVDLPAGALSVRREELELRAAKQWLADNHPGEEGLAHHRSGFFATTVDAEPPGAGRELDFNPLGGAYNRVAPDATAFAHRDARFCLKLASADREWVERTWASLAPLSTGGVYPNFAEADRDPWDPAYHLGNRARLLAIRAAYDPEGLWSAPPTPQSSTPPR